jgi:hypothetical protein
MLRQLDAPYYLGERMGTLLSLSKSATAISLEVSEVVLLFFGIVLVAGLIGEYVESWKKWIKLFEMLVIVGVAGELLADGGIFLFSKQLQTISDLEVAKLNESAGKANERAAILEERLADRHVNLKQSVKMSAILMTHPAGRVAVTFISPAASDAQEYALEIAEEFAEAKWTVVPFPMDDFLGQPRLRICDRDTRQRISRRAKVIRAYNKGGLVRLGRQNCGNARRT